jgi:hypothetical protein
MVKDKDLLNAFERDETRRTRPDYFKGLKVFESLYQEAKHLNVFPLKDPLEGMEGDFRLAKALNVRTPARKNRARPE